MPRPRRRGALLLIVATAAISGCATPGPSTDPASSGGAPSSEPAAVNSCQPIDLRTREGDTVDLTGAWQGGVTFHEVRQSRDCVWWAGFSSWPGDELGSAWLLVFSGRLAPDFTLTGEWAEIFTAELHAPRNCPVTFRLEFTEDDEIELVTDLGQDDPCNYYAETMVRVTGPVE